MKNTFGILLLALAMMHSQAAFAQTKTIPVEEYKLKNGLEIKMIEFGSIPAVTLCCYVNVGRKTETPGQQYMAQTTAEALLLGNEKYSRIEQDNLAIRLGGQIEFLSNDNYTRFHMVCLDPDASVMLDVFSAFLLKPVFPPDAFKSQVQEALDFNKPAKMDITDLARMFSYYVAFGTANPLGRHFYEAQLNKITVPQLKEFYQFNYTPKNIKLVLAGKFDRTKMKEMLEARFGSWTPTFGENNHADYEVQEIKTKDYYFVNKKRATQTCLRWTKKAPDVNSKDATPFRLASEAFNVMLFEEIRAKEGKTYGIRSQWSQADNNNLYAVSTQVRNEVAFETTTSFDRVLKQFYTNGITQADLDKAKATLKGDRLSLENPLSVIEFFNPVLFKDMAKRNEFLSSLDAITLDQTNKALRKYFSPDSYKLVMVGDESVLDPQLQKIDGLVKIPLTSIEKDN